MRKVRVVEDVVSESFTVSYKDHWWQPTWKFFRTHNYDTNPNPHSYVTNRDTAWRFAMSNVEALEKEKIVYETPKPLYYP